MSWQKRKQLAEQRGKVLKDAQDILDKAADETRELNEDETRSLDTFETRATELAAQIGRYDKLIEMSEKVEQRAQPGKEDTSSENDNPLKLSDTEKRSYSILRVIESQMPNGRPLDGLERELSQEIALRSSKQPQGVYVPHNIAMGELERRDLDTTTGTGAVGTVTPSNFIELLRAKLLVRQLGAMVMTGLVGNMSIPKQTGGATAAWVSEGNAPSSGSNQTVGQVSISPNTLACFTDMSRKFIQQSSFDAESFVRNDLAATLARSIDAAVYAGEGTGAEPLGIINDSNVATVEFGADAETGGTPTHAKIVELETKVAAGNADIGNLHYVTNAKGRGKLKVTKKANNYPAYLWESEDNMVNGYMAHATNLVPDDMTKGGTTDGNLSGLLFGNWADVIIGMWSGLDILVDPYTNGNAGTVRVNALQDVDIALRHAESFAKCVDMTTT